RLAAYVALAQVGLEMVVPVIGGLFVDAGLGTSPWLTILGAVVGLVGGITHLVILSSGTNEGPPGGGNS
ncbi:AtpZ/AtpI family protein, partial [Escherichia coli]|uniref:AtpZ/AtpI family protein n=1 Tax=Escherichia coli TaxID=562 RepID=UPI0039E06F20